jgi:hypothetical protein
MHGGEAAVVKEAEAAGWSPMEEESGNGAACVKRSLTFSH